MIISDLNYCELTAANVAGGSRKKHSFNKGLYIDKEMESEPRLASNLAIAQASAYGANTLSQVLVYADSERSSSYATSASSTNYQDFAS